MVSLLDSWTLEKVEGNVIEHLTGDSHVYIEGVNPAHNKESGLEMIHYFALVGSDNRNIDKRVIMDEKSKQVIELTPSLNQIDIFNANIRELRFYWGLHARKLAGSESKYAYDGMLDNVLQEFRDAKYTFNKWKNVRYEIDFLEDGKRTERMPRRARCANLNPY